MSFLLQRAIEEHKGCMTFPVGRVISEVFTDDNLRAMHGSIFPTSTNTTMTTTAFHIEKSYVSGNKVVVGPEFRYEHRNPTLVEAVMMFMNGRLQDADALRQQFLERLPKAP